MEDIKKLEVKNWKEVAKDRRTVRDLAKTHKVPKDDDDDDGGGGGGEYFPFFHCNNG